MAMSRPPCEDCGTPRILLVRKHDSSYRCPDCETEITVLDGIDLMMRLNETPAYSGSLLIDQAVRDAYDPPPPLPYARDRHAGCPKCGTDMIQRHGRNGAFLGCLRYPDCKGTRPVTGRKRQQM